MYSIIFASQSQNFVDSVMHTPFIYKLNLMTISHSQMNLFTAQQILEKHLIAIPFKHVANAEHTKTRRYCTHINIQTYLCMKTVFMPKALAMAQACWPPAPPKHASTCSDVSCPLACWEKADIQYKNLDTHPVKQQLVGWWALHSRIVKKIYIYGYIAVGQPGPYPPLRSLVPPDLGNFSRYI